LLSDLFALLCSGKRFFVVTFTGSIMWIAAFSYLMVWWANLTGETVNIPPEVSPSLTLLKFKSALSTPDRRIYVGGRC